MRRLGRGRWCVLSVAIGTVLLITVVLLQGFMINARSIAVLENRDRLETTWFPPNCPQDWLRLSLNGRLVAGTHTEVDGERDWIDGRVVQQVLPFEGPGIVVITVKRVGLWQAFSNGIAPITYLATMYECPDGVTLEEGEAVALLLPPGCRSKVHVNPYPDDRWWKDSATVSN